RLFEAQRLCLAAYEFFRTSPMRGKALLAELLLARIALRMNDLPLAERHCQSTLAELEKLDSPLLQYQANFLMGEIARAGTKTQEAYQSYCRAREAIEHLRGNLVDLCLRTPDRFEEAFGYIEQAKSRALMDLLSHSVHVPSVADPGQSELVRSIRNFREELNWYYNLIEREQLRPEERSQERIKQLEKQARAREADLMRAL